VGAKGRIEQPSCLRDPSRTWRLRGRTEPELTTKTEEREGSASKTLLKEQEFIELNSSGIEQL